MAAVAVTETVGSPAVGERIVRLGRVALATQGLLYVVVGLLAARVAGGHEETNASQKGAIATVARQPFGRALLVVLAAGLATHVCWRLALAVRGEPGEDEDGKSVAKRVGNLGRAVIYGSFTYAAIRILLHASAGGDRTSQRSTARVLAWPGGTAIVLAVGLGIAGAAAWNLRKALSRSFLENLDLTRLDDRRRRLVAAMGVAGYVARAVVFSMVAWFLVQAALHRDPRESGGLDSSLHRLAATTAGPILLSILAVGLVLFGAFRVLDGVYRTPHEITWA